MRVYLIGLNHSVQYTYLGKPYTQISFRRHIESAITQYSVSLIAEELSVEAIERQRASGSIVSVVAASKGIEHRYVDPDSRMRESLGIPSERLLKKRLGLGRALSSDELRRLDEEKSRYHSIREEYWLSQIREHCGNVLFLCGDSHVESFFSLLKKGYVDTVTLSRGWNTTSSV